MIKQSSHSNAKDFIANRSVKHPAKRRGRLFQQGGTLLGLIVGLIIGLSIAVVVAVTIKSTPLPFVNKLGKPDKPGDSSGQIGDPNKPLYGNNAAAKEAAKPFVKKAEEERAAKEAQAAGEAGKPELPATAKLDAKPEIKPDAGAPVIDKSAPPKLSADKLQASIDKSAKPDNAEEKFIYYLQAGAFLEQADAENTKAKLALLGVSANIAERKSENGTLYRVRIGPFSQMEAMSRMRSKLSDNGVDVAVVRMPK